MMERFAGKVAVAAAVLPLLCWPARGWADTCSLKYDPEKVQYWSNSDPVENSVRCDWSHGTPTCQWYGWLWKQAAKKPSKGNLPLVILVHGSGETHTRSSFCEQVNRLVKKGYVVFMPYMRGVTDTSTSDTEGGWRSTGTYIEDYVADHSDGSADSNAIFTLSFMLWEAQDEVQFALTTITNMTSGDRSKPLVNREKVAIMGHSYGGAVVTIAASQSLSPLPAATLDLSGGVLSWAGSIFWPLTLDAYAAQHQMPLYLQQTMNESPTGIVDSTLLPFLSANGNGSGGAQMSIWTNAIDVDADYQASCDSAGISTAQCRHGWFLQGPNQVDRWWGTALNFLTRHGVK